MNLNNLVLSSVCALCASLPASAQWANSGGGSSLNFGLGGGYSNNSTTLPNGRTISSHSDNFGWGVGFGASQYSGYGTGYGGGYGGYGGYGGGYVLPYGSGLLVPSNLPYYGGQASPTFLPYSPFTNSFGVPQYYPSIRGCVGPQLPVVW